MACFVSHPLGVDLRGVFITFEPASTLMTANVRRFTGGFQNGNVGQDLAYAHRWQRIRGAP